MWKFYRKQLTHNQGFTLFESLIALMVNSLVLLLVVGTLQNMTKIEAYINQGKKNIEWHIMLNQIENDVQNMALIKVLAYEITFEEYGSKDKISYALSAGKIKRFRNGKGYVPMLNKVKNVKFTETHNGFAMESHFTNGQVFKGAILSEKKE